jgi:hypothetical protein
MRKSIIGCLLLGTTACSVSEGARLNTDPSGKMTAQVRDMNPEDLTRGSETGSLDDMRFRPEVCQGIDLRPDYSHLSAAHFLSQLKTVGMEFTVEKAREDLIYVDVKTATGTSRYRVATLPSAPEAGRHLHEAILQHGPGSWGVHRANLAVLGPIGSVEQVIDVAATTKLCCWGVVTVAGRDDSFVVPGGYLEF